MKKVVILSAFITPFRSGAEACTEEIARELKDRFAITIVTARLRKNLPKQDALSGVQIRRLGIGSSIDKFLYPFLVPFVVRELKPEIVHAVLESYAGLAMVFTKWIGVKAHYILTCQSTNTSLFIGLMHRTADNITVISRMLRDRAVKYGRRDAILIPNGLRLADMPTRPKVPGRILFVGRLESMKGVDTLLTAFATLPSQITLHIVGDGSLRSQLEKQSQKLGVDGRVNFLGFIPTPVVYEEFATAEIFCGFSRSEALGNVFIEAQAAGCAVVATNVGGIPDIVIHEQTGLLVSRDNAAAAAAALRRLTDDPGFRNRLAATGKQNAQQYDWSAIAERYGALYG